MAGDKVFAVAQTMAEVYVYDATGAFVTKLTPGPEVGSKSGRIDVPWGFTFKRANGEYLVFVEEEPSYRLAV